jgi:hypothetical protein
LGGGAPSVPLVGVEGRFQLEEDRILVVPEEVAVGVEEVLSGGVGDQAYSVVAGDERVVPGG